jgi:hypothetical protein
MISVGILAIPYETWHIVVWAATVAVSPGAFYAANHREAEYLDKHALVALRSKNRDP